MRSPNCELTDKVFAPVCNYYGTSFVAREGEGYVIGLEDWDGDAVVDISREFYEAWLAEFKNKTDE